MVMYNRDALIKAIMGEIACPKDEAIKMMNYVKNLDDQLQPVLDAWIEHGEILYFAVNGVDLPMIMDKLQTSFLPALFHMSRFINHPEEAERFKRLRVMIKDVPR